jgi:hypothetical protein
LNESQRAMVAAKIATLEHGGDRKSNQAANLPLDAVELLNEGAFLVIIKRRIIRNTYKRAEKGEVYAALSIFIATLHGGKRNFPSRRLNARIGFEKGRHRQGAVPRVREFLGQPLYPTRAVGAARVRTSDLPLPV